MRPTPTALLGIMISAFAAEAQEPPARRLTLEDAFRAAQIHNPHLRQALAERKLVYAQRRQGIAALLPTLSATLGTGGGSTRFLSGQGNLGEVIESENYVVSRSSSASQSVTAAITLFDGGANLRRIRESVHDARAIEARIRARTAELRAVITARYLAALQAAHALRLEEDLLASAREQLAITQRRFEIGSASREDLLGAELQVADQEQYLGQARGNLRKMKLYLLREIGVDDVVDIELHHETTIIFDPDSLDEESLISAALASSPRIIEREALVAARKQGAGRARGARLPRITATGTLSRSAQGREFDALFDLNPRNRSIGFSISASLPIFSGFQISYNVASAELQLTNATEQLRAERIALATEIRAALVELRNAYDSHRHAERSLALSQERLELTEERYRAGGAISFIDLQYAIDAAARAKRRAIDARFAFFDALVALEARIGREVRP